MRSFRAHLMANNAVKPTSEPIGLVAMDAGSLARPYAITPPTATQLTTVQWPNGSGILAAYQDAVFFKLGPTTRGALLTSYINNAGTGGMSYVATQDGAGLGSWSEILSEAASPFTENALGHQTFSVFAQDGMVLRVLTADYDGLSPQGLWNFSISTNGGSSWYDITGTLGTLITNSTKSPGFRVYGRTEGSVFFYMITQSAPQGGSDACQGYYWDSTPGWGWKTVADNMVAAEYVPNMGVLSIHRAYGSSTASVRFSWNGESPGDAIVHPNITNIEGSTSPCAHVTNMRLAGDYIYVVIRDTTSWSVYRVRVLGVPMDGTNAFVKVFNSGNTTANINSVSTPKAFSDGNLRFIVAGQIYVSADGASWAAEGSPITNTAGQLSP